MAPVKTKLALFGNLLFLLVSLLLESDATNVTKLVDHADNATFVPSELSNEDARIDRHHLRMNATEGDETRARLTKRKRAKGRFKRSVMDYKYEDLFQVQNIQTQEIIGDPIPVSNVINCNGEQACPITKTFTRGVTVTYTDQHTFGLTANVALDIISLSFQNQVAKTIARSASISDTLTMGYFVEPFSKGRLVFIPRLLRITGEMKLDATGYCREFRAATIFTFGIFALVTRGPVPEVNCWARQHNDTRTELVSLLAPIMLSKDSELPEGTTQVEYEPNAEPIDDVNFLNIRHKDLPRQLDYDDFISGSPKMCAKWAMHRGVNFAVWRDGKCYIKSTENRADLLCDEFGKPFGRFHLAAPIFRETTSAEVLKEWKKGGVCDIIQEYAASSYYCKNFEPSPGTVMMFRRAKV